MDFCERLILGGHYLHHPPVLMAVFPSFFVERLVSIRIDVRAGRMVNI